MSWRRIFLWTGLFVVALLLLSWLVLRHSGLALDIVRSRLAHLLHARFDVGDASFDLAAGRITVDQFALHDPRQGQPRLVALEHLQLDVDVNPLGELVSVHAVTASGLVLDLDLAAGLPTIAQLLQQPGDAPTKPPTSLPPIDLDDALVRLRLRPDLPPLELTQLQLHCLPQEDAPTMVQLEGSLRCSNLDLPLRITGQGDLARGNFRLSALVTDQPVDSAMLQRLRPFFGTEVPQTGVGGRLQRLQLWLDVAGGDGSAPVITAGLQAEFADLYCDVKVIPYPLRGAQVDLSATTQGGGSARFHLARPSTAGSLDIVGTVTNLFSAPRIELRGSGHDVPIDDVLLQALRRFPAGANITAALQPTAGRADAELYIRQPGSDDELIELDLQVRDAELAFLGFGSTRRIGFPLALTAARGSVRLRDKSIHIDDVTARIVPEAGGGEVRCSGRIDLVANGNDRIRVDVDAPSVQFSPAVRQALGYLLQDDGALWDQFAPAGSAAVSVHVRPDDDPAGNWLVRVEPHDCTASYRRFPLPVSALGGELRANPQGVELDLHALAGGGPATLRGRLLPQAPGDFANGRLELHVHTERTAVDAELRAATTTLLPALTEVWDQFDPGGRCSADLALSRDQLASPRYDLHLQLAEGTLRPRPVTAAFADVHGDVYVHGAEHDVQIEVDALRGRLVGAATNQAEIAVIGTLGRGSSDQDDVTTVVRGLPLDEQLGLILNQLEALDARTWSLLRPSGLVDVVLRWQRAEHSKPHQHLTVHLRDVTSDAAMLPHRATHVTGQLEVTDGVVAFTDVHAQVGTAPVTCTAGHVRPAADGSGRMEVAFTVSAERFPLDEGLKNMFSGPLRQAVDDRQLRGAAKVKDLKLTFLLPQDDGQPQATIVQGLFEAQDVQLLLGTRVLGINGVVRVDESTVTTLGGGLHGALENGSFQMFGHTCTDFRAGFTADAERIIFRDLAFALYGGAVRGRAGDRPAIEYRLAPQPSAPGTLALDLIIQGVRLSELLRQSGVPPGLGYRGTLLGELTVNELRGSDLVDMDAEGALAVVDGFLGTVEVFKAIYALMPEANRPRFESGHLSFRVKDRMVTLSKLLLRSKLITVAGEGKMAMDGYLDVVLTLDRLFGPGADLTVLPLILRWLTSPLVRFHLFGYLRDLQVEQRWFTERDPRRQALTPVPALLEKAKRPGF